MKHRKIPFSACSAALLILPFVLTACGGGGGGGKAVKPTALNVVVGTGATSSTAKVEATDATTINGAAGTTYPTYLTAARASGRDPSAVSASITYGAVADTLSVTVDGVKTDVQFDSASITDHRYDMTEAQTQGPDGLTYATRSYGEDTLDYARFGFWERGNADEFVQSNEVLAAAYGGRETPVAAVPTGGTATYRGTTHGIGIATTGEIGEMRGDIALNANFASASIDGTISNVSIDQIGQDLRASLNGSLAQNTFSGNMDVTNRAGTQDVGKGQFDGRFFGPGAEEVAGKWDYVGSDGTKAIGAFGAKR